MFERLLGFLVALLLTAILIGISMGFVIFTLWLVQKTLQLPLE